MNDNISIISIIGDDNVVPYHAKWNAFTGSPNATIFLRQMIHWWDKMRRPFFKFATPCKHDIYLTLKEDQGQLSWCEELGFTRRQFATARDKISTCTPVNCLMDETLVTYWVDKSTNLTWYALNENKLLQLLADIYPQNRDKVVGTQPFLQSVIDSMTSDVQNVNRSPHGDVQNVNRSPHSDVQNVNRSLEAIDVLSGPTINTKITSSKITPDQIITTIIPPTPLAKANQDIDIDIISILDWMGFVGELTKKELRVVNASILLSWAYWIKINQDYHKERGDNPVGIARSSWKKGKSANNTLLELAKTWLRMSNDHKWDLIDAMEKGKHYARISFKDFLPDNYPHHINTAAFTQIWQATDGEIAPPHLMPIDESESITTGE